MNLLPRCIACCAFLFALLGGSARGQDAFPEFQVKAAFLYNFIKFVHWPDTAFRDRQQALNLVVLGTDPFGKILDKTFSGKTLDGRTVHIRRETKIENCLDAHLLFISRSEEEKMPAILQQIRPRPILTVSEQPNFARDGGMIELKVIDLQVCFDLNQLRLKEVGLSASGQMVKIARSVHR